MGQDSRTIGARALAARILRRGVYGSLVQAARLGPRRVWQMLAFYGALLRMHIYNLAYDLWHGTETRRNLPRSHLQTSSDALASAVWYTPVPVRTLRFVLRQVAIDYADYSFIDYGAGKGRAMLTASELPFKAVIGLEFASNLVKQAERNLERARRMRGRRSNWQMRLIDARDYQPPVGNCWFFLYAPFYGDVLESVLDNIYQSRQGAAGDAMLCFVDDEGSGGLVPAFLKQVEQWDSWERIVLPPQPADMGALYPLEIALYRKLAPAASRYDASGTSSSEQNLA